MTNCKNFCLIDLGNDDQWLIVSLLEGLPLKDRITVLRNCGGLLKAEEKLLCVLNIVPDCFGEEWYIVLEALKVFPGAVDIATLAKKGEISMVGSDRTF